MHTQNDDIQQLEMTIQQAQAIAERGRKVLELVANPTFKDIIDDGYLLQEAARLAHLMADSNLTPAVRADVERSLTGPGSLKQYLMRIIHQGRMAEESITDAQEELVNAMEEDAHGYKGEDF